MRIKPKKRLGQNFLVDKNIQRKILDACAIGSSDIVLEIGAGRGELTEGLASLAKTVVALELDSSLCRILENKFRRYKNIKIINQDILKFDIDKYFSETKDKIKVAGNIPYYITSPIIEHLLKYKEKIDSISLTLQKEFGQRIIAHPGSKQFGAFSCFVQFYTSPKIVFTISKSCFYPAPKVDSCLLRLDIRRDGYLGVKDEARFFKLIRCAFNQRRKTLRNSLKDIVTEDKLTCFFRDSGLSINIRPEVLSLEDFAALANL